LVRGKVADCDNFFLLLGTRWVNLEGDCESTAVIPGHGPKRRTRLCISPHPGGPVRQKMGSGAMMEYGGTSGGRPGPLGPQKIQVGGALHGGKRPISEKIQGFPRGGTRDRTCLKGPFSFVPFPASHMDFRGALTLGRLRMWGAGKIHTGRAHRAFLRRVSRPQRGGERGNNSLRKALAPLCDGGAAGSLGCFSPCRVGPWPGKTSGCAEPGQQH